jgi:hypothetical protein
MLLKWLCVFCVCDALPLSTSGRSGVVSVLVAERRGVMISRGQRCRRVVRD